MNPEEVYAMCMEFPYSEATFPFDENTLVFKISGKMFALYPLEKPHLILIKCDPFRAIELREQHSEINAAWHMNKRHWIQIDLTGSLSHSFIKELVAHSYGLVVAKLPRKIKNKLNIN